MRINLREYETILAESQTPGKSNEKSLAVLQTFLKKKIDHEKKLIEASRFKNSDGTPLFPVDEEVRFTSLPIKKSKILILILTEVLNEVFPGGWRFRDFLPDDVNLLPSSLNQMGFTNSDFIEESLEENLGPFVKNKLKVYRGRNGYKKLLEVHKTIASILDKCSDEVKPIINEILDPHYEFDCVALQLRGGLSGLYYWSPKPIETTSGPEIGQEVFNKVLSFFHFHGMYEVKKGKAFANPKTFDTSKVLKTFSRKYIQKSCEKESNLYKKKWVENWNETNWSKLISGSSSRVIKEISPNIKSNYPSLSKGIEIYIQRN